MNGRIFVYLAYLHHFHAQKSFAQLVKEAKELGYTEPDPRLDLSGTDVMRKFLISAREAGEKVEMADVDFKGFVPVELLQPKGLTFAEDEQEFYAGLEAEEVNLKAMYENAAAQNKKLRFAATLDKTEQVCRVGLIEVDSTHPFYSLEGSDNAMLITTEYYPNGVVIKGAGAGARQTASGLLNDILN